jgi:uncharacterized protein
MSMKWLLQEKFQMNQINDVLKWYCEPKHWFLDKDAQQLVLKTERETDFWQRTHYGFQADNGHFLHMETRKNFRMTTKVEALPANRYDQAGLMIRFSEDVWLKTSIEYIPDGPSKLGAVVTNHGYSDWSTQYIDRDDVNIYLRISKINNDCYVDYSWDGEDWSQIRIAHLHLPKNSVIQAGIYACSPQGENQSVRFDFLTIEELGDAQDEVYL